MRVTVHNGSIKLWLSARDTEHWASRPGCAWPCSELAGSRLFVEFDARGDLVDVAINGTQDCSSNELNAIAADLIRQAGQPLPASLTGF